MIEDELYEIPKIWECVKLDDIAYKLTDGSHNPPKKQKTGIPMLSARNVFNNSINLENIRYISNESFQKEYSRTPIESGDILLTTVGTIGRSSIVHKKLPKFAIQRSVTLIKTKINGKYLSYFFQSSFCNQYLLRNAKGTAQKGIYLNQLKKLPVPLPPLNEQNRIVSKIEELFTRLDAGISELKKAKKQLKIYHHSVLNHTFEGKLTEKWRKVHKEELESANILLERIREKQKKKSNIKSKEIFLVNTPDLIELPDSWAWATFSQLGNLISGQHIKKENYNFDSVGIEYLTGPADFSSKYPIITKWTTKPKAKAKKDDVLVTVKGAGVGKVNLLDINEAAISRQLMAIRCIEINPNYIFHYINSNFYYFQKLGSSSTVPGINRDQILKTIIPIPSIEEQNYICQEIESRFSLIDKITFTVDQSLIQAKQIRQSILKKAFEGKLVPQDPADEPAAKLMERIKAEADKQKTKKRIKSHKETIKQSRLV